MMVRQILHRAFKFAAAVTVAAVLLLANFPFPCSLPFVIENILTFGMIFAGCFLLIALGESFRLSCKRLLAKPVRLTLAGPSPHQPQTSKAA